MKESIVIEGVYLGPFLKAFKKFEKFRKNIEDEQDEAGAIQAFEYCFELSWKTMKKLLEKKGKSAHSPKEVFRMAVLEGYISNPEAWFDFLEKRNLSTHTYEEDVAKEVIAQLPVFSQEVKKFFQSIGITYVED